MSSLTNECDNLRTCCHFGGFSYCANDAVELKKEGSITEVELIENY